MHRSEVLNKYSRLLIGTIEGEKSQITYPQAGVFSTVPYAEPGWLTKEYMNPYFTEGHRNLAKAMRLYVDENIIPEARASELTGERPSNELLLDMSDKKIVSFHRLSRHSFGDLILHFPSLSVLTFPLSPFPLFSLSLFFRLICDSDLVLIFMV